MQDLNGGVQLRELAEGWRVLAQQQLDKTLDLQQRIVALPSVVELLARERCCSDSALEAQEELELRLQDCGRRGASEG